MKAILDVLLEKYNDQIRKAVKENQKLRKKVLRVALSDPKILAFLCIRLGYKPVLLKHIFRNWDRFEAAGEKTEEVNTVLLDIYIALKKLPKEKVEKYVSYAKRPDRKVSFYDLALALGEKL